jgi:hypothetical protein
MQVLSLGNVVIVDKLALEECFIDPSLHFPQIYKGASRNHHSSLLLQNLW